MARTPSLLSERQVTFLLGIASTMTFAGIMGFLTSLMLLLQSVGGLFGIIASLLFLSGVSRFKTFCVSLGEVEEDDIQETHSTNTVAKKVATSVAQPAFVAQATVPEKKSEITSPSVETPKRKESDWASTIDWEQWVGQKLLQKLGIVIVLIGMAVLLKYSFDNRWIDELGRLLLSALVGVALIGAGEYFRKRYPSWSNSFTGGGLILLYFTIWAAQVLYGPILSVKYGISVSPTLALGLYSAVTAVSALASIRYSSQTIAWFALFGGYLTPLLIQTDAPNIGGLAAYLAVLTAGLLALARFKSWKAVSVASFVVTELYLFGTIYSSDKFTAISDQQQIVIAVGFFLLFALLPIINQFASKRVVEDADMMLIAVNGVAVFLPVTDALGGWQSEGTTFVCLTLASVYIALSALAIGTRNPDARLTNAYMAGGIGLVALAIYRQMGVEWFAAGFAPYSLGLLLLSVTSRRSTPFVCGTVVMGLALVGLMMNAPIPDSAAEGLWHPFTSNWSIMSYIVMASLIGWIIASGKLPEAVQKSGSALRRIGHVGLAVIVLGLVTFETTRLHYAVTTLLSFSYLGFVAFAALIFFLTAEAIWFFAAIFAQLLVLIWTFGSLSTPLSLPGSFGSYYDGPTITPVLHAWSLVSVLSIVALLGLMKLARQTRSSDIKSIPVNMMIIPVILAQVWLHVTVEIHNASLALLWTPTFTNRLLSAWWIVFALAVLILGRSRPYIRAGIGLLIIPMLKDFSLILGNGDFYETVLWTVIPLALAAAGARRKDFDMVKSGVLMLSATTALDMLSHLGYHNVSLHRSIWWAFAGLLALVAGFVEREKLLRRIAMFIFGAATVKLLIFDFSALQTPVRIAASIGTGLLMIGGSYLYQRFSSRIDR